MNIFLCLVLCVISINAQAKFYVVRQWKYVNNTWPDESTYKTAVDKGLYIPDNNIIAGIKYYDHYYYLTLPRMKNGVAATLARIKAGKTEDPSPKLEPYPSWEMNAIGDCNNLQNVQNTEIDTKGQMWIIDSGRVNTFMETVVQCPPKLVIFDIKMNKTTTVHNFTEDVAMKNTSFLYDIVVDDEGYAYITDNSDNDPGIIVYSLKENRSWKLRDNETMRANPSATHFVVNDIQISAPINIAGIALGPKIHLAKDKLVVNNKRDVYFSPLSSLMLYSISTSILQNRELAANMSSISHLIKRVGPKSGQTAGMVMDNKGMLYLTLLSEDAIGKWDSSTPFHNQRLIAKDARYIEWPSSLAFDDSGNITIVVNRMDRFLVGKLDLNEYNFRLISANVGGKSYLYDEFRYEASSSMSSTRVETTSMSQNKAPNTAQVQISTSTPSTTPTSGVDRFLASSSAVLASLLFVFI